MYKFLSTILCLIILHTSSHSQTPQVQMSSEPTAILDLELGASYGRILTTRIEIGYSKLLSINQTVGGKIGFEQNGPYQNRILLGGSYQYFLLKRNRSPFIEVDAYIVGIKDILYPNVFSVQPDNDLNMPWYISGIGTIYAGYRFQKEQNRFGVDVKVGYGGYMLRYINMVGIFPSEYSYGEYKLYQNFSLIFGFSYQLT